MTRRTPGFTMMEMLAVLAVVAVLASLALPSYFEQVVRDQVKTALPLADIAKPPIAQTWQALQAFPEDNAAAGLPAPEKVVANYVRSVVVRDGAIDVTFGNRASQTIAGKTVTLRPAVVEDAPVVPIAWVCGYAAAPTGMTLHGQNRTDVPPGLLPIDCRALSR